MCVLGSTTTALTGESGSGAAPPKPVQSVHEVPAFVVCHTWPGPAVKPITVTYAVLPVGSEESMATAEIGNWVGLMLLPPGPFRGTFLKVELTPDTAVAFVVTQALPPMGVVGVFGPKPSVRP